MKAIDKEEGISRDNFCGNFDFIKCKDSLTKKISTHIL